MAGGVNMIKNFEALLKRTVATGSRRVAVAAANDTETLAAVTQARAMGISEPLLVGNK